MSLVTTSPARVRKSSLTRATDIRPDDHRLSGSFPTIPSSGAWSLPAGARDARCVCVCVCVTGGAAGRCRSHYLSTPHTAPVASRAGARACGRDEFLVQTRWAPERSWPACDRTEIAQWIGPNSLIASVAAGYRFKAARLPARGLAARHRQFICSLSPSITV